MFPQQCSIKAEYSYVILIFLPENDFLITLLLMFIIRFICYMMETTGLKVKWDESFKLSENSKLLDIIFMPQVMMSASLLQE